MKKTKLCYTLTSFMLMITLMVMPFVGIRVCAFGETFERDNIIYELQEDDSYAVIACNSGAEKTVIPSEVNGKQVARIKSFSRFTGKEVELPNTVIEIEPRAFMNSFSLSKITLPDNLEVIPQYAFSNCYRLRTVRLPKDLKSIGESAFSRCYLLESINLPNKVENIDKSSFLYCHLLHNIAIADGNNNFKVLEDGSLVDNKEEIVVLVNKKDLAEKEMLADIIYSKLKELMPSDMSLESLYKNIDAFMQERGGGKPEVISKEEFDNEVLKNRREVLYRGIREKCYFESLKNNEKAYFPGGFNGNGIYTTGDKSYADGYALDEGDFVVARMYLKDNAKSISVVDIDTIRHIIISKHYDEFPESEPLAFGDLPDNVNRELILNRGLMASILGYDVLDSSEKDGEFEACGNEKIVVNRSKLVICDE